MANKDLKEDLALRELDLKVRELKLKVEDLEKPSYKKLSYWTSIVTVVIAIFGFGLQSYLSNIKNAKADLDIKIAEAKKDTLNRQIKVYNDSLGRITNRLDSSSKALKQVSQAYIEMKSAVAFSMNGLSEPSQTKIQNADEKVSGLLLKNNFRTILKAAIVKIYYLPALKEKAESINKLLTENGVQSGLDNAPYDISHSHNQVVYYNDPQLDYSKAVLSLLNKNGWTNFELRKSSQANVSTQFFKIYLTS
ncbi:hypothetical protein SAMN05192574_103778 [Mucilaginibacter gossypiicola]|uniref:Uncharacterized protein n=1 Tax=Mucilaginibacter gossypiicola TaxID=551995 RepID=A0A1H8I9W2_9SPHI|nr:hypothetical protein [Mucilaginibacter gossypiicola]SEN65012.1 hypothetical protein SAMN05192574_103778 [Mucilaginibacter gossypiicola]